MRSSRSAQQSPPRSAARAGARQPMTNPAASSAKRARELMPSIVARYAGEHHGFKMAAAVAYGNQNEESISSPPNVVAFQCLAQGSQITTGDTQPDCHQVGSST